MNLIKNSILAGFCLILIFACRNEKNQDTSGDQENTRSKNETSALKGTPAEDISDIFIFRRDQFVPEHNNAYQLRSKAAFSIYIQGTEDPDAINFDEYDVIALFHERIDKEVNFKVESFDNNGEETRIDVSTIRTDNTVSPYRPSFLIKIPKSEIKGRPVVRLNGVIAPLTTAE